MDGEAYRAHVRSVMETAGWHWPEHLLLDPSKGPRFLSSADELLSELQLGTHMDEVLVLPDGVEKLGQSPLDPRFQHALGLGDDDQAKGPPCCTAYEVLEKLAPTGMLHELRGKVSFRLDPNERKKERDSKAGGPSLAAQWESLAEACPPEMRHTVYVSEIRLLTAQQREPGASGDAPRRWRKSSLARTMRERAAELGLDARDMLYWDDYSEGTFIGGDQAGYKIHVDCIQTSNIGSMYAGHKLLAIWKYPQESLDVIEEHLDTHFVPPLTESQTRALESACKIVLAPPGCIYLFSGCNAHAVLNVGWAAPKSAATTGDTPPPLMHSVRLSLYEALCGLHPVHARAMIGTHDSKLHHPDCWMDTPEELEDFEEDVAFNVVNLERRLGNGQVTGGESNEKAVSAAVATVRRVSKEVDELCRSRPWRGGAGSDSEGGSGSGGSSGGQVRGGSGWMSDEEREVSDLGDFCSARGSGV